jgi:hypothetical protein
MNFSVHLHTLSELLPDGTPTFILPTVVLVQIVNFLGMSLKDNPILVWGDYRLLQNISASGDKI